MVIELFFGFIFLLFYVYLLNDFLRKLIFNLKTKHLLIGLVVLEYSLLFAVPYFAVYLPYQLSDNTVFGLITHSRLKFDDSVYQLMILSYILISFTAFLSNQKSPTQRAISYVVFVVGSCVSIIVLYLLNAYLFSTSTQVNGRAYEGVYTVTRHANEGFFLPLLALFWLTLLTRFKTKSKNPIEKLLIDFAPILIWFGLFIGIVIVPFLMTKQELNEWLDQLGVFG